MCDDAEVAAAWEWVQCFVQHGDISANTALYHALNHSLDRGAVDVRLTLAPRLLQWCLQQQGTSVSPAAFLFVAILNRTLCVKCLPSALAQSLDRRPTGVTELFHDFLTLLRDSSGAGGSAAVLSQPVQRQLRVCAASLLVQSSDNAVGRLVELCGPSTPSWSSAPLRCLFFQVFLAVMEVLGDHRIPLGPVNRATQRRHTQRQLQVILSPIEDVAASAPQTASSSALWTLHAEVLAKAVVFVVEGMTGEPQQVAPDFWFDLPSSAVWQWCLRHLQSGAGKAQEEEAALDAVCGALRCLSEVDETAERLLIGALTVALRTPPHPASLTGDVEAVVASCKVIAASLEASTEAVVLFCDPAGELFQLFSSAAEYLVQVLVGLLSSRAMEEAVPYVCEGLSALTQVLQPIPIPPMEPTDDLEDYEAIVESMEAANEGKTQAVARLRSFLSNCQTTVCQALAMLTTSGAGAVEDATQVAQYAVHQASLQEEDYAVFFDLPALALFTTYERLCGLLQEMPPVVSMASAAPPLVVTACDSRVAFQAVQRSSVEQLASQAVLLPVLSARFVRQSTLLDAFTETLSAQFEPWSVEALQDFAERTTRTLEWCATQQATAPARHTCDALMDVFDRQRHETASSGGGGVLGSPYLPAPLITRVGEALWSCVQLPGSSKEDRWRLAEHLARLIEDGLVAPTPDMTQQVVKLDACTQVELLSSFPVDSLQSLEYILRGAQELGDPAHSGTLHRACARLRTGATQRCESGAWAVEAYAALLDAWNAQRPQSTAVLTLTLAQAVANAVSRATMQAQALFRFFSLAGSDGVGTEDLSELLDETLCRDVSALPPLSVKLLELVGWLLHANPVYSMADGVKRVHVLSVALRVLSESGHCGADALAPVVMAAVDRLRECVSAATTRDSSNGVSSSPLSNAYNAADLDADADRDELVEKTLEQLAVVSRCVAVVSLPPATPPWLRTLAQATDDYERKDVIKRLAL